MATASATVDTSTTRNKRSRNATKLSTRKISEVKEVIQNRSDHDIQTVLEHYDFDVGKTISAFISDDAKEILLNSKKKSKENSNMNASTTTTTATTTTTNTDNNDELKPANNETTSKKGNRNKNTKLDKNNNSTTTTTTVKNTVKKSFDINSLVDSIVNKYTNPNEVTTNHQQTPSSSNNSVTSVPPQAVVVPVVVVPSAEKTTLYNNNNNSKTNVTSQQANDMRPSSLELNNKNEQINKSPQQHQQQSIAQRYIPTQQNTVININAKKVLEKSQKDLQRQIVSLNKLNTNFDEEIEKTQHLLRDLFNKLRTALDDREVQLQIELEHMKAQGTELFANRQKKATEFKLASDRAEYLTESQVQELKSDIKNFVSERKLDEELGMAKRFIYDFDKVEHSIKTFGQMIQINTNHYTFKTGALLNESNTNSSENNTPITTPVSTPAADKTLVMLPKALAPTSAPAATNGNSQLVNTVSDEFNKKLTISDTKVNGHNDNFIETKKPQRTRNKQVADAAAAKKPDDVNNVAKVNGINHNHQSGDFHNNNKNSNNNNNNSRQNGAKRPNTRTYMNGNGVAHDYKQQNGYNNHNGNYTKMNGNAAHAAFNGHGVDQQLLQSTKLNGN